MIEMIQLINRHIMKKLRLSELKPDPILNNRFHAQKNLIPIAGFLVDANETELSISSSRFGHSYRTYSKKAISAVYQTSKKSERIVLLVDKASYVKHVRVEPVTNTSCSCESEEEIGVAEARPLKSIHKELAKQLADMRKTMADIGNLPGASDLSCGEKFSDCMREGGIEEDCRLDEEICRFHDTFGK